MERSQSCTEIESEQLKSAGKVIETSTTTTAIKCNKFHAMKQKSVSGSNIMNVNQLMNSCNEWSVRRRRKMLQRQQSREYADDDIDYIEYAADHEDEEDDLDLDEDLHTNSAENALPLPSKETQLLQRTHMPIISMKKAMLERKPLSSNSLRLSAISYANSLPNHMSHAFDGNSSAPNYCCTLLERQRRLRHEESFDSSSSSAGIMSIGSPNSSHRKFSMLKRDNSIHSDSSRYSSVDSLLEARKPDPEAILNYLGFGPVGSEDILSRIPKRFLKPSQVPGNDTEAFVRRVHLANSLADHSVLGYRGLTGNPDMPPSTIVAQIMRRFEVNERKKSMACIEHTIQ